MATSKIKNVVYFKRLTDTLSISSSAMGFKIISLSDTLTHRTPTGYRYVCTRLSSGSALQIRNSVIFAGMTANMAAACFYVNTGETISGTIELEHYFISTDGYYDIS